MGKTSRCPQAKTTGNATLACGSAKVRLFKPVSWLGQSPQATLRSPAVVRKFGFLSRCHGWGKVLRQRYRSPAVMKILSFQDIFTSDSHYQ
ncbi:MAG: hypothetical protein LBG92_07480 [Prevotellaceae bacterium]|jgi:hypothetical protein|nr:hypothetical protein [Prevotellaceae bacterium]